MWLVILRSSGIKNTNDYLLMKNMINEFIEDLSAKVLFYKKNLFLLILRIFPEEGLFSSPIYYDIYNYG